MVSPIEEAAQNAARRTPRSRLLTWTLIVAVALYVGLSVSFFVPFLGLLLWVFIFCALYLWAYVGIFASAVVFMAALLVGHKVFQKRRHRLQFALQLSAIAFAVVGIVLMVMVHLRFGQSLEIAGYSLHTRLWLDADKVRIWADSLDPSDESALSPVRWPLTIKLMAVSGGHLHVDGETMDVIICHGSALSGHYGIYVTARGKNWTGERWADTSEYDRIKKIEDGVWVWSSLN